MTELQEIAKELGTESDITSILIKIVHIKREIEELKKTLDFYNI